MAGKYNLYCLLLLLLCIAQQNLPAQENGIDSLKKALQQNRTAETNIRTSFLIADSYMEEDQYDSAQLWLNKIATQLPLKEPSLFNYFLASRQAEVYYYNGLQRLGLQEAERSLSIAQKLNDSLLLADSYNFLGLFYINLDSFSKAVPLFYQGISFIRQPPYPERYNNLSMPHHLYGNMAEAFEKKNALDSSIYFSRLSLREAAAAGSSRAMALANYNLGSVFLKQKKADSAFYYFSQSLKVMGDQTDFDVALINYGGLASAADLIQNKVASITWLQKGFGLLHEKTTINNLFKGQFLDGAIVLYEKFNEKDLLVEALHLKADLLSTQTRHQNQQMNSILNAGLQNETRLLNLQVKEAAQQNEIANTRVYLLLLLLILLAAGFLFYRYKIKQKLEVVRLQNKISQDLHDDVGSSLSSLQVYSAVAERLMEDRPAQAKEMLRKIARESSLVLENIGDIVWSIKPGSDQSLEERIKNFVADVLGAANINYRIVIEDGIENTIRNMEARKNILLIIKEAVNNTLKYSKASHVSVNIKKLAGHLCIQIADDGIGFQKESLLRKGAGLSNMEQRTLDLGGIYELITSPGKGTTVSALLPLTKISDSFR